MLRFIGLPGSADPYVKIATFDFRSSLVLEAADRWSHFNEKIVNVNAIDNGTHGANTLHGMSLAWDFGVEGHTRENFESLANFLKVRLPPPYEVIVESDHVHVEWDTHQGR